MHYRIEEMLNAVIVGCGRIFAKHASAIERLSGEIRVSGIIEKDDKKAIDASNRFKCKKFFSIEEFIEKSSADIAIILTPSGLHATHIKKIIGSVNTILVEKPACLNLADLGDLCAFQEQGKQIFVVKQNRYNQPIMELKSWQNSKSFGELVYGTVRLRWCRDKNYYAQDSWRGTWAYDGGVLTNQASHHIDILQMFMGEVEEVYATSIMGEASIEVENTALVNLRFKNGALGFIEATTAIRPTNMEASLSLIFDDSVAEIGGHALNNWLTIPKGLVSASELNTSVGNASKDDKTDVYGAGHKALYQDLLKYFKNQKHQLVDIVEGGKSLILLHAIYESIETGLPVSILGSFPNSRLGMVTS
jgi:UDP-N-acetyl-2-amino-2-deoxyglucuronate dehydrogenase